MAKLFSLFIVFNPHIHIRLLVILLPHFIAERLGVYEVNPLFKVTGRARMET